MRSFFHKFGDIVHKYPIRLWNLAEIDKKPHAITFDGSSLRLINLLTAKEIKSISISRMDLFSNSLFAETNTNGYEQLFFFVYAGHNIKAYDVKLCEAKQFDFDAGMTIIGFHWHKELNYLYLSGTNGWLKCYHLHTLHTVTEFIAKWDLVWEIHTTSDWIRTLSHDDFTGMLYGGGGSTLYVWDLKTGEFKFRVPQLHSGKDICQIDVDPKSSAVFTSGKDGMIKIWNAQPLSCKLYNSITAGPPGFTTFSRLGRYIATISCDRVLRHFNIGDAAEKCSLSLSKVDEFEVIKPILLTLPSNDGELCVTVYDKLLQVINLGVKQEEEEDRVTSPITQMCFINGQLLQLCQNNFYYYGTKLTDVDALKGPEPTTYDIGETTSIFEDDDTLYLGLKNGGIKVVNVENKSCTVLEGMDPNDAIDCITIVENSFNSCHPVCSEHSRPVEDRKYVIGYSRAGFAGVWCTNCCSIILKQKILKGPISHMHARGNEMIIAIRNKIILYRINSNFKNIAEMRASQPFTTFDVAGTTIIAGTSIGEVIIVNIEDDGFTLVHHLRPAAVPIYKVYYASSLNVTAVSLVNGTSLVINQNSGKIISQKEVIDAVPLSSVVFREINNHLLCTMAFGLYTHSIELDTYEPPPPKVQAVEEEEEEKAEKNEEVDDTDVQDAIKYLTQKSEQISKMMKEFHRKRPESKPQEPPPPSPAKKVEHEEEEKEKPTFDEIMRRNQMRADSFFRFTQPKITARKIARPKSRVSREVLPDDSNDLIVEANNQPQVSSDIPAAQAAVKKLEIPEAPRSVTFSRAGVVYYDDGRWIIGEGDPEEFESERLRLVSSGHYVLERSAPEMVRPPVVLHTQFVGPPVSHRILFDDPTTRNGLDFFDPRGFEAPLLPEKEDVEKADEKQEEENEEEEEEEDFVFKRKAATPPTELEIRRAQKKERVSIRSMMTNGPPKPANSSIPSHVVPHDAQRSVAPPRLLRRKKEEEERSPIVKPDVSSRQTRQSPRAPTIPPRKVAEIQQDCEEEERAEDGGKRKILIRKNMSEIPSAKIKREKDSQGVRKLKDQKINIGKEESSYHGIYKLKTSKFTKKKPVEVPHKSLIQNLENEGTKAVMKSPAIFKVAKKKKSAVATVEQPATEEEEKEEEVPQKKEEEQPEKEAPTVTIEVAPEVQKRALPKISQRARMAKSLAITIDDDVLDYMSDRHSSGTVSSANSQRWVDLPTIEQLPNLALLWEEKHVPAFMPFAFGNPSVLPKRSKCAAEFGEFHVDPVPFCPGCLDDLMKKFNAIFNYHRGTDRLSTTIDEAVKNAFESKERRLSF